MSFDFSKQPKKHAKTNASLQLGDSVEEITDERAVELLAERRAKV